MENQYETRGKTLNFSQATRTSDITVDTAWMKQHDEQRAEFMKLIWQRLVFGLVMVGAAVALYVYGHWIFGSIAALLALFALALVFLLHNASGSAAYTSGALVPAIVVRTAPIELLALANVDCSEEDAGLEAQWAYKRFSVKRLPLHQVALGERVPCIALFGGEEDGRWTQFDPRPLCWATSDAAAIRRNTARIDGSEWEMLSHITDDTTAANGDIVLLGTNESTGRAEAMIRTIIYGEISFRYPETWKVETEDYDEGSYQIACEKKGDNSSAILTLTADPSQISASDKLHDALRSMRKQKIYQNIHLQPIESTTTFVSDGFFCSYTFSVSGTDLFGRLHTFRAGDKTFTLIMQDEQADLDATFKFFTDSFTVGHHTME